MVLQVSKKPKLGAVEVANNPQLVRSTSAPRRGADGQSAKMQKTPKNADNAENTRTIQEKHASAVELSPVDPADMICSSCTENGEIRLTGLLLATFNKVHILTY